MGRGKGGNALNRAQKKDGVIKTREKNSSQNKCTFLKSFSFEWSSTKDWTLSFFPAYMRSCHSEQSWMMKGDEIQLSGRLRRSLPPSRGTAH